MLISLTRRLRCSEAPDDISKGRDESGECAREIGVGVPGSMKRDMTCWPGEVISRVVDGGVIGSPPLTTISGKPKKIGSIDCFASKITM